MINNVGWWKTGRRKRFEQQTLQDFHQLSSAQGASVFRAYDRHSVELNLHNAQLYFKLFVKITVTGLYREMSASAFLKI